MGALLRTETILGRKESFQPQGWLRPRMRALGGPLRSQYELRLRYWRAIPDSM